LVQEARPKIGASHTRFSVLWALLRTPWALLQSSDWPRRQKYDKYQNAAEALLDPLFAFGARITPMTGATGI